MPYGHIKQYLDLVEEAQRKRMNITKRQERQIVEMYSDIAHDLEKDLAKKNSATLSYRWVKDYAKSLKSESKGMYKAIQDTVTSNMLSTTNAVVGVQNEFWGSINPNLSERFRDVFSSIPQQSVNELIQGGVYKDFTGLSERIWNYKGKFNKDIGYVINRGIIAQKSAFDLAKDLELYLDPRAKKPFDWSNVYPGCNKAVDYSAQRLARTSVTHAYQLSFQRSTVDNPFIEKYKWLSSNSSRVCELCRQRNGRIFDKDLVPLDHPNGMCVIVSVIGKSYDQIADELADWANGGDNPNLDKWIGKEPLPKMKLEMPYDVYKKSGMTRDIRTKIDSAIAKIQNEYNIDIASIECESMGKCDIFVTGTYFDNGIPKHSIVINSDVDYNKIKRRMMKAYSSGRFAGKSIEDYMAHELAHIIPFQDCKTESEYRNRHLILSKQFVSGISGYADKTQNGTESLAEAFVKYRNGEKIPLQAKTLIATYIERWKK